MKQELLYYVIIFGIPLFGIFSLWRLEVNSRKVYARLDDIWSRAKKTDDKETLQTLYKELADFSHKYCFVKHYGNYARQVGAYINGKLSTM